MRLASFPLTKRSYASSSCRICSATVSSTSSIRLASSSLLVPSSRFQCTHSRHLGFPMANTLLHDANASPNLRPILEPALHAFAPVEYVVARPAHQDAPTRRACGRATPQGT